MKKIVTLLLTILLTTTTCFSQTTSTETNPDSIVSITSEQLKYANLIFVEHEKLLTENNLLNSKINSLQDKLKIAEDVDSLRLYQISQYKGINNAYALQIQDLNRSISKKDKTILGLKIGCVTVSVGVVLLLLLK